MKLYIKEKVFSWGKKLHVYDMMGREVAFIKQEVWSWMPRYYVFCGGRQVAEIKKEFTFFFPKYTIDGLGWEIDGSFMAHEYAITQSGRQIVSISKKCIIQNRYVDNQCMNRNAVVRTTPLRLIVACGALFLFHMKCLHL